MNVKPCTHSPHHSLFCSRGMCAFTASNTQLTNTQFLVVYSCTLLSSAPFQLPHKSHEYQIYYSWILNAFTIRPSFSLHHSLPSRSTNLHEPVWIYRALDTRRGPFSSPGNAPVSLSYRKSSRWPLRHTKMGDGISTFPYATQSKNKKEYEGLLGELYEAHYTWTCESHYGKVCNQ